MPKLSIVIPVYCNEESLERLYRDLKEKAFPFLEDYEVVMVDDGSSDHSWDIMKKLAEKDDHIQLLKLSRNFGSHAAILAGLEVCNGDCALVKAADLQEPSSLILKMLDSWKEGNKVVLAVRENREDSFMTKFFADEYYKLVRKVALKNMPEHGFDVYLIDRKVIDVLEMLDEKNSALTLQILWAGFKTGYVGYNRVDRQEGKSKWTLAKKIKLVVDSVVSFSFTPVRMISYIGIISSLVSVVWAIVVLVNRLLGNIPVAGYTTLAIIVLFSSGLIMCTLGVLGEYIWRTMDNSRKRPVYIVEEQILNGKK